MSIDLDEFHVYNTNGQIILNGNNYTAFEIIDLSNLASGLYILEGKKGDTFYQNKIYKHWSNYSSPLTFVAF